MHDNALPKLRTLARDARGTAAGYLHVLVLASLGGITAITPLGASLNDAVGGRAAPSSPATLALAQGEHAALGGSFRATDPLPRQLNVEGRQVNCNPSWTRCETAAPKRDPWNRDSQGAKALVAAALSIAGGAGFLFSLGLNTVNAPVVAGFLSAAALLGGAWAAFHWGREYLKTTRAHDVAYDYETRIAWLTEQGIQIDAELTDAELTETVDVHDAVFRCDSTYTTCTTTRPTQSTAKSRWGVFGFGLWTAAGAALAIASVFATYEFAGVGVVFGSLVAGTGFTAFMDARYSLDIGRFTNDREYRLSWLAENAPSRFKELVAAGHAGLEEQK